MKPAKIKLVNHALYAEHNMPCPVCSSEERVAVYNCNDGVYQPCWYCQAQGWVAVQATGWKKRVLQALGVLR